MNEWYAEIDKTGFCFHTTQDELPLSDTILLTDENVLGKVWNGTEWVDVEQEATPQTSQLDRMEEMLQKSHEEIKNEAIDEYTAMLMEEGVL